MRLIALNPYLTGYSSEFAQLGESPVWDAALGCVWWVDIEGKRLLRSDLDGETTFWDVPEMPGFVQITARGVPLLGMESGLFHLDPVSGKTHLVAPVSGNHVRFNDSCSDTYGRIWAGTMDIDNKRPCGVLYLIDGDKDPQPVLDGFTTINGLAWDTKASRLFLSDSHPSSQTIWTIDCPGGRPEFASRRIFARMHALAGRPDGGAVDADGNYWIAGIGGAQLYQYAPDGTLRTVFDTPMPNPTKPVFCGPNLDRLALSFKAGPGDGGLAFFDMRPLGVRGAAALSDRS